MMETLKKQNEIRAVLVDDHPEFRKGMVVGQYVAHVRQGFAAGGLWLGLNL